MPKRITEKEIERLVNDFRSGILVANLVKSYGYSKATINKYLKKNIEENEFKTLIKISEKKTVKKNFTKTHLSENQITKNIFSEKKQEANTFLSDFYEIEPLDFQIDDASRKELTSVPLDKINFPEIVYMIVDKNIELRTKLLRDYPSWRFLPEEDLNRNTIEIFFDMKVAKSFCNKEQKVIKIPNTNVFKIVAPLLLSRGISRIVSEEQLITI